MTASAGKKRILIIVQNLPVPFDRRVWNEAKTLAQNGYKVSVISPTGFGASKTREVIDGVTIYRHPRPWEAKGKLGYVFEYVSSLFWEFTFAGVVFFREGFDAVHACNPPDTIFLIGAFYKFLFGKKFVFDHHDLCPELYEAKFGKRGALYTCMRVLERMTFALADISIAPNESYREIAVARGKMPSDQVFIVRSGPDLERMKIGPAIPALKHGKKYLVGYLGVMGKQEGIPYLIDAVRHITQTLGLQDTHFTLIGSGPALKEMKQLAAAKGVSSFMTFTGRIADAEMLAILNSCDICVNPDAANAMNNLSTMNKIMEYMALGKPIVQFDLKEGRVSAGEASLYAKPNNATDLAYKIITLLDDPAERKRRGEFGRNRVESELSWPHEAPKLLAAYAKLFQ